MMNQNIFTNEMNINNPSNIMGMNNQMNMMNQMGMVNQSNNLMNDETSSRLKKYIEPYENKIKDLEEEVRKKDFEILVLKEKLYQNNSLYQNAMNMNKINMMGMGINSPMININQMESQQLEDPDIITIIFRFSGQNPKIEPIFKKCFSDDEFQAVKKKIQKQLNLDGSEKYIFNAKNINPKLTISEAGITNNANIFVLGAKIRNKISENFEENKISNKMYIVFTTTLGTSIGMNVSQDISVGSLLKKYFDRVNINFMEYKEEISFLYNAMKLDVNDKTSLKDTFKNNMSPRIVVFDNKNIIGAKI